MRNTARSTIAAVTAAAMLSATSLAVAPAAYAAGSNVYSGAPVVQVGNKGGNWKGKKKWKRSSKNNRHRGHRRHRSNNGSNFALGLFGFAAGAIIGSAIAQSQYGGTNIDAYCSQKYKTYKPWTGTFTGYDGREHPCRYP